MGLRGLAGVFGEIGYAAECFSERELGQDRQNFLQKITGSLDRGIPVIWYRPGMPGIVVGYENGGDTLIYLTAEATEPERLVLNDGFFTNRHTGGVYNYNDIDMCGWVVVGSKKREAALKDIYRGAILRLPKLLTQRTEDYAFGGAAFRAWAQDVENGGYPIGWCRIRKAAKTWRPYNCSCRRVCGAHPKRHIPVRGYILRCCNRRGNSWRLQPSGPRLCGWGKRPYGFMRC